ncbi:hypothetical protein YC2023_121545 [Brassica napus]
MGQQREWLSSRQLGRRRGSIELGLGESGVGEFVSDGNGEGDAEQSCLILWSPHTGKKSGDVKQVR